MTNSNYKEPFSALNFELRISQIGGLADLDNEGFGYMPELKQKRKFKIRMADNKWQSDNPANCSGIYMSRLYAESRNKSRTPRCAKYPVVLLRGLFCAFVSVRNIVASCKVQIYTRAKIIEGFTVGSIFSLKGRTATKVITSCSI
jgi:hypothetical protein